MRVAVLVSGSGTILEAVLGRDIEVGVVVADRRCPALDKAEIAGLEPFLAERCSFGPSFDRAGYSAEVAQVLLDRDIDLVAMAGLGTVFDPPMHDAYGGRMLNTHPALLPAFPGWHAVRDALAYGVKVSGCTVHVAGLEVDTGPILAQEAVPVLDDDTEETLHERIKAVERRLYPETIDEDREARRSRLTSLPASVYDKAGVVDLAAGLADLGWDLVSSGGTAAALREAGLTVTDTEELTGFPAILGHRVDDAAPQGARRSAGRPDRSTAPGRHGRARHRTDRPGGRQPVPVRLGPARTSPMAAPAAADLIDIGGPAMVRAAAKNHAHVGVVVDPGDYEAVLAEVRADGVAVGRPPGAGWRPGAFATTSAYDAASRQLAPGERSRRAGHLGLGPVPGLVQRRTCASTTWPCATARTRTRRPPCTGPTGADPWWAAMTQHAGLPLSYLNLYDADAAWLLVHDLALGGAAGGRGEERAACAIIKHANPCGAAVGDDLAEAYQKAFECDPRSAFGGIVALSRPIDDATVEAMVAAAQADVVIAPGYGDGVVDRLVAKRKNTRLLEAPAPVPDPVHLRPVTGGYARAGAALTSQSTPAAWEVVTQRQPTAGELADAELAFRICGWVKSNSIVLVKDGVAWGIGAGQQNRVEAGQIAADKAAGRAKGGACASDAFYPFPDGIEAAASAGVAVIVQPGGSMNDDKNVARADELGVAMVFTGERHFLH